LGLSIGLAACILCFLHIQYELSYDQFYSKSDRIYRVVTGDVANGDGWVKVSAPIPPLLKDEIPEIEEYARFAKITYNPKISVKYEDRIFNEPKIFMADPAFARIFDLEISGKDVSEVLKDPNSITISRSIAEKYFGNEDAIGKNILINNQFDFEIESVYEDLPENSHIDFDFLISFENLERIFPGTSLTGNWGQFNYFAYLLLYPESSKESVETKIRDIKVNLGNESEFDLSDLGLQALTDVHFQDNRGNQKLSYNPKYLYIYTAVALAILIISLINFINMSIAGSTKRVREVGVRKVIGATKYQLVRQFISESFLITFISIGIALLLIEKLLLPITNDVLNSNMSISYSDPNFLSAIISLLFIISFFSGSYISFFVTSFRPIEALKGAFKIGNRGGVFKNVLLGIQFSISIMLILGSVFVYKQLLFLKDKDIGMKTEQVISVALYNQEAKEKANLLKKEFSEFSWVENISGSRFTAGAANWNQTVQWEGQEEDISMFLIMADENVIETLDLQLIEGDLEALKMPLAEREVRYVLNEAALETIGWDVATGQSLTTYGSGKIYGVVKNYNFRSLHHNVAPCILVITERTLPSNLLVKVSNNNYQEVLSELEVKFNNVVADTQFEYNFLDDEFQRLYESESRTAKIVGFLTVIAIILALLGLYGLLSFVVQERTKEMAIRKVLGVKFPDIIYLLSSNFLKLLLLSNAIAIPIIWVILNNWLNSFNYKIELNIGIFIIVSMMIWTFVLITIGFNVIQVNKIDPVKGLKYE
jgi:putative ABC transport system permease protein